LFQHLEDYTWLKNRYFVSFSLYDISSIYLTYKLPFVFRFLNFRIAKLKRYFLVVVLNDGSKFYFKVNYKDKELVKSKVSRVNYHIKSLHF
jgi:hypothetical protein